MGFSGKNSYILGLMTLAFIVGEIAHFLIGEHLQSHCIILNLKVSFSCLTLVLYLKSNWPSLLQIC